MKIKSDKKRVMEHARDAKKIFILGARPISIQSYFSKITTDANEADLIIITDNLRHDKTISLLSSINHKCNIILFNYTFNTYVKEVNQFLTNNSEQFTSSRRMLADNNKDREKTVLVISHPVKEEDGEPKLSSFFKKITIFLVLKSGGVYDYRYVNATARNIRNNCTMPHEIVCLTDSPYGITEVDRIVPLKHNWDKWWGKIELFREDITDASECIFFDLDTVCMNNIDFLWTLDDDKFYGLRDFYRLDILQTGIMRWKPSPQTHRIYSKFVNENLYNLYKNKGDHEYMGHIIRDSDFIQDAFPNKVVSYKKSVSAISKKTITPSIVCFHGEPRPHTIKHSFITDHWKY